MDELVTLFRLAQGEFGARVDAVTSDEWGRPTIDSEWDVGDLVDHLLDENRWVAPLLGGRSLEQAGEIVVGLAGESDRRMAWRSAAADAARAVSAPDALAGSVQLSRGPTPAAQYITEMIFDHTIHAWDLGKAVGSDRPLPGELVSTVYSILQPLGDLSQLGGGMFAPPVTVPDDAPIVDKLVALTGRDPGQSSAPSGGRHS
jgi:uncharacterized protein (TIGR03086 family)